MVAAWIIGLAGLTGMPESWLERGAGPEGAAQEAITSYVMDRLPQFTVPENIEHWEAEADTLRHQILEEVIYKGVPEAWRAERLGVEWDRVIEPDPSYRIRLLRYEVVPGFWLPAALYEPTDLEGKVPAVLNVNGHFGDGKGREEEQIRHINLAKRGIVNIHPEWLRTGQTEQPEYAHNRIAQYDLCGVRGVSLFYLAMKRALDVLVDHPNADPDAVAMTGLSGGGWQTIFLSALDTRIRAAAPNAGYTSLATRLVAQRDIGDYEQIPGDFATLADYPHLTALLAPRPAMLIYNAADNCCFMAGTAIPSVYDPVRPLYDALGIPGHFTYHINDVPGTHNYGEDNREAFYRLLYTSFGVDAFPEDLDVMDEVFPYEDLYVPLPEDTLNVFTLGDVLAEGLPRSGRPAEGGFGMRAWRIDARQSLRTILRYKPATSIEAPHVAVDSEGDLRAQWEMIEVDGWPVSTLTIESGRPERTLIAIADGGFPSMASVVERSVASGQRVVLVDPVMLGANKPVSGDWQYAMFVHAVGGRILGLQAAQINAVAAAEERPDIYAQGPAASLAARCAAAIEPGAYGAVYIEDGLDTLQRIIDERTKFERMTGVFCFGLYERFDIDDIDAIHGLPVWVASRGR